MSVVSILILIMVLTSAGFGCVIAWLFAQRGLAGSPLRERLNRLETEVMRLQDRRTRPDSDPDLEDEVHRLDEKVAFLENLLVDGPQAGVLPPPGREGSRDPDR